MGAKRQIIRTGAKPAKVMRRMITDAIEKYGSRPDINESKFGKF
jgi:hypothetical protein